MPLPHLFEGIRKMVCATTFKWVLDIIWIKTHCLKGEDKWESSRRLDASGPDIEVY